MWKTESNSCPTKHELRRRTTPSTFIHCIDKEGSSSRTRTEEKRSSTLLSLGHVADQVDDTVTVTPLVVVPRDELDKVVVKSNSSLGVEDARPKLQNQTLNNEQLLEKTELFASDKKPSAYLLSPTKSVDTKSSST